MPAAADTPGCLTCHLAAEPGPGLAPELGLVAAAGHSRTPWHFAWPSAASGAIVAAG